MSQGGKPSRLIVEDKLLMALVHRKVFIDHFWRAKAPGLRFRKWVCIDLILTHLRTRNRGSFRAARSGQ